ncbi:hypothetical protein TorRG33x02_307680 [Trema orientale]|uniref:Uncharacterized protein n=1 Tax=Trema orientale TaxID=63057 RepID=A0A2P5BVA0_TREOI|nr:hypothetical protein TorRG33x02_307680 [Trema orientale]
MVSNPKNTLPNSFKLSHNFPKVRSNAGGGGPYQCQCHL